MATKPTVLPRWAETAGGTPDANILEPNSGQKDTGWVTNQVPPSSVMNWLQWLAYKWIAYLDDLAAQAFTWTAAHIFNGGLTGNSAGASAAITGANSSTGPGLSGTNSSTGPAVKAANSSTGPALEVGAGHAKFTGSNPSSTTGFANSLTTSSIAKAWACIQNNAGSGVSVENGFNIASVTRPDNNHIKVTFATAMADVNYAVTVTTAEPDLSPVVYQKTTTDFQIRGRNIGGSSVPFAFYDFSTNAFHVNVHVDAIQ